MNWLSRLVWMYVLFVLIVTSAAGAKKTQLSVNGVALIGCALYIALYLAQKLAGRLLLIMIYCVVFAHATFYAVADDFGLFAIASDSDSAEKQAKHDRHDTSRKVILTILFVVEFCIVVGYIAVYEFYPYAIHRGWINTEWWFDIKKGKRTNTLTYLSLVRRWNSKRSVVEYIGGLDKDNRPHGFGLWKDSAYHGENLSGLWDHGIPIGPFTSREQGSGFTTEKLRVAYASIRGEKTTDSADIIPTFKPLEWGVANVECSVAGGFFSFLPSVEHFFGDASSNRDRPRPKSAAECIRTLRTPLDYVSYHDVEGHEVSNKNDRTKCQHYKESLAPVVVPMREVHQEPKEALVYIHGIYTPLDSALSSISQIMALGDFPPSIHPFVFGWPSGSLPIYFFQSLRAAGDVHSATGLRDFFASIIDAGPEYPLPKFVAAGGTFDIIRQYCELITLYGDSQDQALLGSEFALSDNLLDGRVPSLGRSIGKHVRDPSYPIPSDCVYGSPGEYDSSLENKDISYAKVNQVAGLANVAGFALSGSTVSSQNSQPVEEPSVDSAATVVPLSTAGLSPPPSYSSSYGSVPLSYSRSMTSMFVESTGSDVDGPAKMKVYLDMDVIDTSFVDVNTGLRHSYYRLNTNIVDDIREIVLHKRRARARPGLMKQKGNVFIFLAAPSNLASHMEQAFPSIMASRYLPDSEALHHVQYSYPERRPEHNNSLRTQSSRKQPAHEQLRHSRALVTPRTLLPPSSLQPPLMAMSMRVDGHEHIDQLPSHLRHLELHAVDLDDDDDTFSASPSSSTATTVISADDGSPAHAHTRKEDAEMAFKVEMGLQEEQLLDQQHTQHLTSDFQLMGTFTRLGVQLGLGTLVAVAAISTYAMLLVVQCKYKLKEQGRHVTKYGEIGQIAMGRFGAILVNSSLVISQTGFCVAYLIFIASNAHKFLEVSKELVVSVCVPPLIAFSLLKHMKELAFIAILADCMNFLGLAVVYTTDLTYMALDHDNIEVFGVVSSIPFFFGVASYCFEGVGMVLPLENSMQTKANFTLILVSTVVIITSIYATFGICGYLAFGDATQDVITLNIEGNGGMATLVKLFLCAGLFFTYPVMLFPVFEVLQPLVSSGSAKEGESSQSLEKKAMLLRASVVLLTAIIAAGIPNFGRFISFIGSTCCSLLGFVLPTYFYLRIFDSDGLTPVALPKKMLLYTIMLLGLVAFVVGVVDAVVSILNG
ncbi:Amino acid/auxin permease, partial [Globisporangium splendens]